jgi:hypothetical protein
MKPNPLHPWDQALTQQSKGHSLLRTAADLLRLQAYIQTWPGLRGVGFALAPAQGDTLKILVNNSAALARIKQSVPNLIGHLHQAGWHINHIQLQIQTRVQASSAVATRKRRAPSMGPQGEKAWQDLAQGLTDPHLKAATERLIKRRG